METNQKLKSLKKQASIKGLNEDAEFIKKYNDSKLKRKMFSSKPQMINYTSKSDNGAEMLCLPGTITIFIGVKKSGKISKLKEVLATKSSKAEMKLMNELRDSFLNRKLVNKQIAQEMLLDSESHFKISCNSKTILDGGFLTPDSDITYLSIPYCGTPYPKKFPLPSFLPDFEFKEYLKEGIEPNLETLILYHEPNLSELEKEILFNIPEDSREILVGVGTQALGTCIWYASAVALAAIAVMTATASCADIVQLRDIHLKDDLLKSFSAEQAAEELLNLRERALMN